MDLSFSSFIKSYFNVGVKEGNDPETNRQVFVINLFGLVGQTITFLLAVNAFFQNDFTLAISLFIASFVFYSSHLFLRLTKIKRPHRVSANILLSCLMLLMIYLVYSGGANNTGPLWIYLVPPVALFFGGMRTGLRDVSLFVLIISLLMFYPQDQLLATTYSFQFKTRLLLSFMTVTFLSAFYEYSRQQSYKAIQELNEKAELQARQDPLTELVNRRGMREHLKYEFNRSLRSKLDMSILLVDVDHFKKINDTHGHEAGDCVLRQLAELFQNTLRKQDIVARWGGEEFLFLLPETNALDAFILAEKLRKKIEKHDFEYAQSSIHCTISLGLCEVTEQLGIDQAINQADHYLYQAKEQGRNLARPEHTYTN